ncbi:hypothetical protein ACS0TY_007563 [Phlomoides rotata]
MLRNRSRAVTSKQALMADQTSFHSPTKTPSSPISSFLGSPRFFNGFLSKNLFDSESPTSILDAKNSPNFVNPFGLERSLSKPRAPSPEPNSANKTESEAIGLALIDSIIDENLDQNYGKFSNKPINRMALFGSKLNVQIPITKPTYPLSPVESPKSPADFGIKTRNSHFLSPFSSSSPAKDFTRQLSLKEMELSEDYTCVIIHGPNPKTTHIYDNCIVESSCVDNDDLISEEKMKDSGSDTNLSSPPSLNFMSFCHTCKDVLGQDRDIYIYRGEKAFCSQECRCEGMISEGTKNLGLDDDF